MNKLVSDLTKALNDAVRPGTSSTPNRGRRRRRRRNRVAISSVVAPSNTGLTQISSGKKRRSRRGGSGSMSNQSSGTFRVSRREFLSDLKVDANKTDASFVSSLDVRSFPWLKKIAGAFEQVIWHKAKIIYRPAVGTTTDGLVTYGVDWSFSKPSGITKTFVQSLTPFMDHAVWQSPGDLVLPAARLQSRKSYVMDKNEIPGFLVAWLSVTSNAASKTYGELYIEYDVTLMGTVG